MSHLIFYLVNREQDMYTWKVTDVNGERDLYI